MLFATTRDLDAEEARRLDFRRRLRESEKRRAQVERTLKNTEKERAEIERKFSKVKWLYSCGRAALRLPRRIRKELIRDRGTAENRRASEYSRLLFLSRVLGSSFLICEEIFMQLMDGSGVFLERVAKTCDLLGIY